MKKLLTTLFLFACVSASMNAKTLQPVYFDDPTMTLTDASLTPEQRSFYDLYVHAMKQIAQGEDAERYFVMEHTTANDEVAPLLGNINYDQGTPYNNKCPWLNGGRAVTGCVATAMAQVMRYYQYPAYGTGECTYTGGEGAVTINLEDYPFDWDNMLEEYQHGYNAEQADAVATLMLMCGASLNMTYSKDGSGSDTKKVQAAMKNKFGYDKKIDYVSTENSTNPDETIYYWGEDAVRPELQAGHPLIFGGAPSTTQGGHCFVIDGYKIIDGVYYYHVNWGWGGAGNSYCLLTRLEIGGENYSGYRLTMVYYIYPSGWQGVEEVEADNTAATKFIRNGQLIIERANSQFSVLGQRIQ